MKLFPKDMVVGSFRGFSEGGLEFHADLVLPYRNEFQSTPMHGQFLLVQLETESEAVLGRITSMASQGRLASGAGEDFANRAVADDRPIPEDLLEQYLKYRVNIRVLGVIRQQADHLVFAASHRRLPHVGSKVAFLSPEVLREVAGHNIEGADIGFFALGEFIYGQGDDRLTTEPWMVVRGPAVVPRFNVRDLVARRSFVFARAGFGKSNLIKLLFANLYRQTPTVPKRQGRQAAVGTLIFDPDGEYFWPDDKGRPGLCDVDHLEDKLVVFSGRTSSSPFYNSFVASPIKLDIRRLPPQDVIAIALPPERQSNQNVIKLRRLSPENWRQLVDEIHTQGSAADERRIAQLVGLSGQSDTSVEAAAAKSNMLHVVHMLHDPSSQMLDMLMAALRAGKLCVVDLSQMRGTQGLVLSGLLLQRIFDRNQDEFTKAEPATIPVIAVIEEAQSVLGAVGSSAEGPYVAWVKEGRKYDLGALLVTQQPGSISQELLSQGDNWFIFHLLSAGDLQAVKRANAHFSDDLLSGLLNEPIPGNGLYWSSVAGKSYPIPIRVLSFETAYEVRDQEYRRPEGATFARELRATYEASLRDSQLVMPVSAAGDADESSGDRPEATIDLAAVPDAFQTYVGAAIKRFAESKSVLETIRVHGMPWAGVKAALLGFLPETLDDREGIAYNNVKRALDHALGEGGWTTEKRDRRQGSGPRVTYVIVRAGASAATRDDVSP